MNGVIFGSGIVGLMAKELLAGSWSLVPFKRSRYFSFNPALDDNFIIRDKAIDDAVSAFGGIILPAIYKRCYSLAGSLVSEHSDVIRDAWLSKIFGDDVPSQSLPYWANRLVSIIYDIRTNRLYETLVNKHIGDLKLETAKGDVTEVGDHYFVRGGVRQDFDAAISTIPLNVLHKLTGRVNNSLPALPVYYYHVQSDKVDLEGANQALVVDAAINFYKVTNISPGRYLFYSTREIPDPGVYFNDMLGRADLIDGTKVIDTIPVGPMPDLTSLETLGIFCVGSSAQHDWCMDVSSCLLRIIRYASRDYQPAKSQRRSI